MGLAHDLLVRKYNVGIRLESAPITQAITTTAKQVLKANPDRVALTLVNLGAQIAYLHIDNKVSSSLGLYLDKSGGAISMTLEVEGELVCSEWWVEGAGATNVYVIATEAY